MSDLFVKWEQLKKTSKNINTAASTLKNCSGQVERTRSAIRLSDDVDVQVKSRLSADINTISELSAQLSAYASALAGIADLYQKTEESNIER